MKKDLVIATVKGIGWSIIESWGGRLISMSIFFLLARLLGPEPFGLIALASVYTSFIGLFIDQGLSIAIVQRQNLEPEHLDAAFWISLAIGVIFSVLTVISSDFIAVLFKQPDVAAVIRLLSISFTINTLTSVQDGLLKRDLDFKSLALRSLISNLISGLIAVPLAYIGFGVWTLVLKELTFSISRLILLWSMSDWRPKFKCSFKHYKDLLSFSINILGIKILNFLGNRIDNFLIGFFLGTIALGYYDVAYRLASILYELLVGIIQKVCTPVFSSIQDNPSKLKASFYKATQYTSYFALPSYCFIGIFAEKLITLILGSQWVTSVIVVQILCFSGFLTSIISLNESVLLSVGKSFSTLIYRFSLSSVTFIGFLFAIRWGIAGIAGSHAFANYITAPLTIFFLLRTIRINIFQYMKQYLLPLGCSFVFSMILLVCDRIIEKYLKIPLVLSILFPLCIASISYITIVFMTSVSLRAEIRNIRTKLAKIN